MRVLIRWSCVFCDCRRTSEQTQSIVWIIRNLNPSHRNAVSRDVLDLAVLAAANEQNIHSKTHSVVSCYAKRHGVAPVLSLFTLNIRNQVFNLIVS